MKLSLESYLRKKARVDPPPTARDFCFKCRRPGLVCYCATIKPFASRPRVVILMHPHEVKKPIGTGRMAHHCLANSELLVGLDFTKSKRVNALLNDPAVAPVLMFPGPGSQNLSVTAPISRPGIFAPGREPVIIVLDATWTYAKKMLHRSKNLHHLPRISFDPPHLSKFLVRKQPSDECFSTIEAIHEVLKLLGSDGREAHLMEVFEAMVARQLSFRGTGVSRHRINFLKRKGRYHDDLANRPL